MKFELILDVHLATLSSTSAMMLFCSNTKFDRCNQVLKHSPTKVTFSENGQFAFPS